jgi:methionine-rich copper-binding protein CopC
MNRTILLLIICLALLLAYSPAYARDRAVMLRSDPPDGAVLSAAPSQVRIWLSQEVAPIHNSIALVDADGHALAVGDAGEETYQPVSAGLADRFDSAFLYLCSVDPTRLPSAMTIDLPSLGPGTYRLTWRAMVLGDTAPSTGAVVFRVQPGAAVGRAADVPDRAVRAADLMLTLSVRPNLPGQNFAILTADNTRRPAPSSIDQVLVRFSRPGDTRSQLAITSSGDNRFQIPVSDLAAGDWQIDLVVKRPHMPDAVASIPWSVSSVVSAAAPTQWWPALLITGALACLLAVGGALVVRRRRSTDGEGVAR